MKITKTRLQQIIREELNIPNRQQLVEGNGDIVDVSTLQFALYMQTISRVALNQLIELFNLYNFDNSEYSKSEEFLDMVEQADIRGLKDIRAAITGIRGYKSNESLTAILEVLDVALMYGGTEPAVWSGKGRRER